MRLSDAEKRRLEIARLLVKLDYEVLPEYTGKGYFLVLKTPIDEIIGHTSEKNLLRFLRADWKYVRTNADATNHSSCIERSQTMGRYKAQIIAMYQFIVEAALIAAIFGLDWAGATC